MYLLIQTNTFASLAQLDVGMLVFIERIQTPFISGTIINNQLIINVIFINALVVMRARLETGKIGPREVENIMIPRGKNDFVPNPSLNNF